jgi:perosamine synthetase
MTMAASNGNGLARRISFAAPQISQEARNGVQRVLESGWLTTGAEVAEFERVFGGFVGAQYAVAVSSCTHAIEIALRAMRLPPGSSVLTSTMTFCGAVNAIMHAGLHPVLVDVNPETLMPDGETTARVATAHPAAMVVLHFAGHPAPLDELASAAGLGLDRIVEDAAHALGTWVGRRPVGALSAAACFSFYATKNLPIGEGGMITTDDPDLARFAMEVRLHGMSRDAWKRYLSVSSWRYTVEVEGIKANMTDLQAAIGRGQLVHFQEWQAQREVLAQRYEDNLSGVQRVSAPPRPRDGRHAWNLYVIQLQEGVDRDRFIDQLGRRGIDCSVHFIPLHHQPFFRSLATPGGYPNADAAFRRIVSLPLHPSLDVGDVDRVCEEIARFLRPARQARTSQVVTP